MEGGEVDEVVPRRTSPRWTTSLRSSPRTSPIRKEEEEHEVVKREVDEVEGEAGPPAPRRTSPRTSLFFGLLCHI